MIPRAAAPRRAAAQIHSAPSSGSIARGEAVHAAD